MDGVERPQDRCRPQHGRSVEQVAVHVDLIDPGQLPSSMRDRPGPSRGSGPDDFDPGEGAGNSPVGAVPAEEAPERVRLGFAPNELHESRRVEIELQRSFSRMVANTEDASTS